MNNKEINEYLAEHLFGLKHYDDGICNSKDGLSGYCNNICDRQQHCISFAPDYISNYQQVLEKLQEIITPRKNIMIDFNSQFGKVMVYKGFSYKGDGWDCCGSGDTLGEAICRCVVEYLKSQT